jgi:hypothetical protein
MRQAREPAAVIWLLSNVWWLVPLLIGALALVNPGLLGLLKRVPARAWLALLAVALLGLSFQAGRWYERSEHRSAQATAEGRADAKAIKAAGHATTKAQEASAAIQKETDHAAAEVRTITRTVRAACPPPDLPPRVHELGQQAVERARSALRPAEG